MHRCPLGEASNDEPRAPSFQSLGARAKAVLGFEVGSKLHQPLCHLRAATLGRQVQRRLTSARGEEDNSRRGESCSEARRSGGKR